MINKCIAIVSLVMLMFVAPGVIFAGEYDIKEMTPEVVQALDGRRARFDKIRELKNKGLIGENNKGYVKALGGSSEAENIAMAENKDRKVIYQTIAQQNGISDQIATIEKVFAKIKMNSAEVGDQVQDEQGNWKAK